VGLYLALVFYHPRRFHGNQTGQVLVKKWLLLEWLGGQGIVEESAPPLENVLTQYNSTVCISQEDYMKGGGSPKKREKKRPKKEKKK
jgi:hypothetical protein